MDMSEIKIGTHNEPRRIMLYGPPGIGKSTFASMAKDTIFIPAEDGLANINCHQFPLMTCLKDILDALTLLYLQDHDYKCVAIDSAGSMESFIWKAVCDDHGVLNIEDVGYAKGYTYALDHWQSVLDGLDALRNKKGMQIILVAHSISETYNDPAHESYDRYVPQIHKKARQMILRWCDEVLFANYKVNVQQFDKGFNQTRTMAIGQGERILYTNEAPAHCAKNRLGLPGEMPLDWREVEKYITKQ